MLISSILFLITFIILYTDKEISLNIIKSYIQINKEKRFLTSFLLSLIFPISLTHYLIIKNQKTKINMKKALIISFSVIFTYVLISSLILTSSDIIQFSNSEITLRNQFEQKKQERITFYSKMYVQLSQSSEIAIQNDSSFRSIVNSVMAGQPQSLTGMLTAFKLIDPSINFEQVSKFYTNLTNLANSNREGFFEQEKQLQNIVYTHTNLITQFPGSFYNMYFKRNTLNYTPILTDVANQVNKNNIETQIKVFK